MLQVKWQILESIKNMNLEEVCRITGVTLDEASNSPFFHKKIKGNSKQEQKLANYQKLMRAKHLQDVSNCV